ncbi:MAG: archease [Candidatus Helarchaeota archaeon]
MQVGYKFLDHKSDVYIEACGNNLSEAFEQAGMAIYDTMTDLGSIDPKKKYEIELESEDIKSLLYDYLDELLFIFDTTALLFRKIKIIIERKDGKVKLKGVLWGEEYNSDKHISKVGIKAATYSLMEIIEKDKGVCLRFVMDI